MVSTDSLSSATLNVEALTQLQAAIHALTLSINYAVATGTFGQGNTHQRSAEPQFTAQETLSECGDDNHEPSNARWIEPERPVTAPAVVTNLPDANLAEINTGITALTPQVLITPNSPSVAASYVSGSNVPDAQIATGTIPIDVAPVAPTDLAAPVAGFDPEEVNAGATPAAIVATAAPALAETAPASVVLATPALPVPQTGTHLAISIQTIIDNIPADGPSSRWYVVTRGVRPGVYDSWPSTQPHVSKVSGACYYRCSSRGAAIEAIISAWGRGELQNLM